jgi:hypothetical protein
LSSPPRRGQPSQALRELSRIVEQPARRTPGSHERARPERAHEVFAGQVPPCVVSKLSELVSAPFRQQRRAAWIGPRDPAPRRCRSVTGGRARRRATGAQRGAASERGQGPALLGLAGCGFPGRRDGGLQVGRRTPGRCPRRGGEAPLCGPGLVCVADLCGGSWRCRRARGEGRW